MLTEYNSGRDQDSDDAEWYLLMEKAKTKEKHIDPETGPIRLRTQLEECVYFLNYLMWVGKL